MYVCTCMCMGMYKHLYMQECRRMIKLQLHGWSIEYAYTYMHVYVCIYTHTYVHECMITTEFFAISSRLEQERTRTRVYIYIYIWMYVWVRMNACMQEIGPHFISLGAEEDVYAYIHARVHTHIDTCMHIWIWQSCATSHRAWSKRRHGSSNCRGRVWKPCIKVRLMITYKEHQTCVLR